MTPEEDHRDLMQMMGRRLARESFRDRQAALRTRMNCAWAHITEMADETQWVLNGWAGMNQLRFRYRAILRQIADIGLIAAGGHAEHVERGTVRSELRASDKAKPIAEEHGCHVPVLALAKARWLASDLEKIPGIR